MASRRASLSFRSRAPSLSFASWRSLCTSSAVLLRSASRDDVRGLIADLGTKDSIPQTDKNRACESVGGTVGVALAYATSRLRGGSM